MRIRVVSPCVCVRAPRTRLSSSVTRLGVVLPEELSELEAPSRRNSDVFTARVARSRCGTCRSNCCCAHFPSDRRIRPTVRGKREGGRETLGLVYSWVANSVCVCVSERVCCVCVLKCNMTDMSAVAGTRGRACSALCDSCGVCD